MKINLTELNKEYSEYYIIYSRRSTNDPDNQKNSIDYQKDQALKFAERENYKIAPLNIKGFCVDGIIEEYHSGFEEDDDFETNSNGTVTFKVIRPKFLQLVGLVQRKEIKGIISLCWDRLSRNKPDSAIVDKLINQGKDILFVWAHYEKTSSGALHRDIDSVFSNHYSRALGEKIRETNKKLRAEGKCLQNAPIGYLDMGSSNKPFDPERAPIVKRIFEQYATGGWSFVTLAQWANKQGLTTKPARRKRTTEEKAIGLKMEDIPKTSRNTSKNTIEHILTNPFYIGKMRHGGMLFDGKSHQALIDINLFYRVQAMIKHKTVKIHYPERIFYTYRGFIKCALCGRSYSPYEQKQINYYRSKCKDDCQNALRNINDGFITNEIKVLLCKLSLTEEEITRIEEKSALALDRIGQKQSKELEDLHRKLSKWQADIKYLTENKVNLLRTGVYLPEQILEEEIRLKTEIENIKQKMEVCRTSSKSMFEDLISFSDLMKGISEYYFYMLDIDKRTFISMAFSELLIEDRQLKYQAKEGFDVLLTRFCTHNGSSCGEDYLLSELPHIHTAIVKSKKEVEALLATQNIDPITKKPLKLAA